MCNYCNRHKYIERALDEDEFCGEILLATAPYTLLTIGVDNNDDLVIVAYGDYSAAYKPKFCPECGADLAYRKAKTQLSSLYGKCVADE